MDRARLCRQHLHNRRVPNLYVAGDFARSHIDLVSMEGAISTGLLAAEQIRKDLSLAPPVDVLVPPTCPEWLLALGRVAPLPLAALAKVWASVSGPGTDSPATEEPPFDMDGLPRWPVEVIDESAVDAGAAIAVVDRPSA